MIKKIKNNLVGQGISMSLVINVLREQGVIALFKKTYGFLTRILFLVLPTKLTLLFARKIKKFESDNVDDVIDYSFSVLGGLIKPVQIREEFKDFLTMLQDKAPKVILEIGTDKGGSLFALCKLAPDDAVIVSVDLPEDDPRGGYPKWKDALYMMFKKDTQQLTLLRGDSHSQTMVEQVTKVLNGKQVDFIFIDGDHAYDGVKKDFNMYSTLVKKGGIIAFHDIAASKPVDGVPMFWEETKNTYTYTEFINDEEQVGYGIGCLFV